MESVKISDLSVAIMIFGVIFSLALPLVPYFILRKKMKARFVPVLIGAATFIVAALMLENTVHGFILGNPGVNAYLKANPLLYALYGGLMAGLFEESGRFGAFKLMQSKYNAPADALTYGLGHGGIEAVIVLGLAMLSNIMIALMANSGSLSSTLAALPADQQEALKGAVTALAAVQPVELFAGMVERVGAVAFHVGASVLVFLAATKRSSIWLYPLAIFLHMLLDIPAVLFQVGVLGNVWVLEAVVLIFSGLVLWFAVKRMKAAETRLAEAVKIAE
jgi:uncharacterized membrane protein YhfC